MTMTAKERSDLQSVARMNARVAKSDVEAVAAQRLAEFEHELEKQWTAEEMAVEDLLEEAGAKIDEINARVKARCDELGIRPALRPRAVGGFGMPWMPNEVKTALRRTAKAELDAAAKRAKTEIDRQTATICTEIIADGITSEKAKEMLSAVSSPSELVQALDLKAIEAKAPRGRRG